MNKKIKISVLGVIALFGVFGLFISSKNASAQTVVSRCDSATFTGTVYPNGSPTYAWFNWGQSTPPASSTTHRGPYTVQTVYEDTVGGLSPSTHYYYRAVAQNAGGVSYGAIKDFYTPACPTVPNVTITTDSTSLPYNGSTVIRWNSDNATSCIASGGANGWAGNRDPDGVFDTGSLSNTTMFSIKCSNNAGSSPTKSVTVNVQNQPASPTVNLTADETNINYGESTILRWTSSNATSCSANGANGWSGPKNTNGSQSTGSLTQTNTYSITCYGANNKQANASVRITVNPNQNNDISLNVTADDQNLDYGDSTTIRWNTTGNPTYCQASGGSNGWSGNKPNSGYMNTGSLYQTTTYNMTCYKGNIMSISDSVTVYVNENYYEDMQVTTYSATDVDDESAELNGHFESKNNGRNIHAWFEWGTNSGNLYNQTPSINYYNDTSSDFSYDIRGLSNDKTYYFRAVAQTSSGKTTYGSVKSFRTDDDGGCGNCNDEEPYVTTYSASDITENTATLNGFVDPNGSDADVWFKWGTSSGNLSRTTSKRDIGDDSENFSARITGLSNNTTYYFRAMAKNSEGTDEGNTLSFRTNGNNNYYYGDDCQYGDCTSTAVTTMASNVGQTSARLNGMAIINGGSSTSGYFEYGRSQNLGNATQSKFIGNGSYSLPYYESIFGLSPNTLYYYRAVITNQYGTSRGDISMFRTGTTVVSTNTNVVTGANTYIRNVTTTSNNSNVDTNTNTNVGISKPSLVFLNVSRDGESIQRGSIITYVVNYKNVSSKNLRDVVLRVSIPKELEFMEASRGYYSTDNGTVVVNIGNLFPQEEGSIQITVKVSSSAQIGKIMVVTANIAYTISDDGNQEEVFAYSKNTVEEGMNNLGAAALFGVDFLPTTLLGWLLLLLILILIILAIRWAYSRPNQTVIVPPTEH